MKDKDDNKSIKSKLPSWRFCKKCQIRVRSCPHDSERHTIEKSHDKKWWWIIKDEHVLICEVYTKKNAEQIMEYLNSA